MEIPLPEVDPRGEWFQQAKLGVFLHWGMYAVGGHVSNRLNMPTRPDAFIPWDTYFAQAKKFKAENYDPAAWVKTFREVGAKYAVITTKHHDGFALWDSQAPGALTAVNGSAAGRDLLTPFVEAMRADNMPVGLYFSVSDWHHPDYASMKPRRGTTLSLYGIVDHDDEWSEKEITWVNAPKNDVNSGFQVVEEGTTLLATMTLEGDHAGEICAFESEGLIKYLKWKSGLRADAYGTGPAKNSQATFIITSDRPNRVVRIFSRNNKEAERLLRLSFC